MATREINPIIYIGLGGTGVKSIAHTKKMYEDEFGIGNIPEQVSFIAFDTDSAALSEAFSICKSSVKDFFHLPFIDPAPRVRREANLEIV